MAWERLVGRGVVQVLLLVALIEGAVIGYLVWKLTIRPEVTPSEYRELLERYEMLEERVEALVRLGPKYEVDIGFSLNNTQIMVSGDVVTYITGVITIRGLSDIPHRPLIITINVALVYEKSRDGLDFYIDYTRAYRPINITSQVLDEIQAPWSAFPVIVQNSRPGDWVKIQLVIYVYGDVAGVTVVASRASVYMLLRVV